jgi:Sec-independent protein secretion pathway component TatC
MMMMMVPLLVLYEVGILVSAILRRRGVGRTIGS